MNEIGLDPGIDHCSAMSLIDGLREQGKEVVSFTSFCGGLPAPEAADVPLGYKFSWSPQGVLSAALNGASFKLDGNVSSTHPLTSLCVCPPLIIFIASYHRREEALVVSIPGTISCRP